MSLTRVLEPPPIDPQDEAAQYRAMNHTPVNVAFVEDLVANPQDSELEIGPRVIDLGCGPAEIAILLCQRVPGIEVLAIDHAVEMLELAKLDVDIAGMLDRITLHHADATAMDSYQDAMADTVISNSLLHHLDQPALGLASAVRLVRPGGRVFVRDLARPDSLNQVESLVNQHAAEESPAAQQLFRQSLLAALSLTEIQQLAADLGIDAQCVRMTSDRHWTIDWKHR